MSETLVESIEPAGPVVVPDPLPLLVQSERTQLVVKDRAPTLTPVVLDGALTPVAVERPARPHVVLAGFPGPPGKQGPQGVAGPPGESSVTGAAYTHVQSTPSAIWLINHNLGIKPVIALFTAGGAVIDAEIQHLSDNTAQVSLSLAIAGSARCN